MKAQVIEGMSYEEYAAIPAVRASHLKAYLSNSPEKAAYKLANQKPSTTDQTICQAVHAAVFEGVSAMAKRYSVGPNLSGVRTQDGKPASTPAATTQGKAIIADFYASNPGVQVVGEAGMGVVMALSARFAAERIIGELGMNGRGELTLLWTDEESGLDCKARTDWYCHETGFLTDGKGFLAGMDYDWKSATMGMSRLQTTILLKMGWHIQLAHYRAGLIACGLPVNRVQLALYDQKPPHEWLVAPVGVNVMEDGDKARAVGLAVIGRGVVSIRELLADAEIDVARGGEGGGFDLEELQLEGMGNG
jgi:hypothetical protein